MKNTIISWS